MPAFRPAYLIRGDDHGRIAERRTRLRAMAESERASAAWSCSRATPVRRRRWRRALCAMTFALGRRFVIVDGVERWKDADVARRRRGHEGHRRRDADRRVLRARGGPLQGPGRAAQGGRGGGRPDRGGGHRQAARASALARGARGGARRRAGHPGGAGAHRARRRPPAAPAARAGEARARARRRAPVRRRGGRGILGELGRAQDLDARRRARRRRRAHARRARCWSCASRASACPACSTGWCAGCATRWRSPRRSPPGSPPAQVKKGLRMPSFAADRLIADVPSATSRRSAARSS